MPRRREAVFTDIALRRARDLSTYVSCGSSDQEALESLANDSLLTFFKNSNTQAAPAHDVLEDWAILEWIDSLHTKHDQSIEDFSRNLGKQPAIRRAYRKWVSEYIFYDVSGADDLFLASLQFSQGSNCFVDDTIVAILRSAEAPNFLRRHVELLLADERNYLIRIIHLLRVGCVKNPDWIPLRLDVPLFFPIPDGPAWDTVLELVKENLCRFELGGEMLLLGLIEDWARGVSVQTPYPAGANSVAAIAHWLLPRFGGYQFEEQQVSTLKVIAKIPKSDSDKFLALLRGNEEASRRDFISDKLKKLVFAELEGLHAARDLPEHIVQIGWKYFLHLSDPVGEDRAYHGEMGVEKAFGIDEIRHFEFFPASAIRGSFLHLLRYHPTLGCQFIVDLCNFSSDWYGRAITPQQFVELPSKITLELPDGELLEQWCNGRLWNAYRGSSVAPEVLTSALMALEKWLLELGEAAEDELSIYLNLLLTTGTSVLTTSVVASVATAYPRASVDVLLTLLSAPECIFWNCQRMVGEVFPASVIHASLPHRDPVKKYMNLNARSPTHSRTESRAWKPQ